MKTKIQIKSVFGKLLFEYESENNTIKKTVEKAVQESANLTYANLTSANLTSANLRYANLTYADLRYADLRYANLTYADLTYADLDKRYIQISCIGSSKRMTTYCFDDDIVMCGCFKGTLGEFEVQVNKTHKNNEQYLKEYLGAISYLKSLK